MKKIHAIFILAATLSSLQVFADDTDAMDASNNRPCAAIAKACAAAGFTRASDPNKKFWADCMKPVILGQTVSGVTIDAATVKSCRVDKIKKLKLELQELQKAH